MEQEPYPTMGRAKFELANVLDYLGQEAQAVPLYKEAISLGLSAEYDAYARLQLGSSLRNVGRIEEMGDEASSQTMNLSIDKVLLQTDHRAHPVPIHIRRLEEGEQAPMDLLLLADPSEKFVADYVKRGNCWIAEVSDTAIGVYVLIGTRPETVELVNVAVREDVQGQGIGRRLVLHAIETARKDGFRTIEIGTGNSSVDQLRLYQKCGFRIVGVDIDFFVRHYDEPIYENGIQCRDMIRLNQNL